MSGPTRWRSRWDGWGETLRHLTLRPGSPQMGRAEVRAGDVRPPGEGAFGESAMLTWRRRGVGPEEAAGRRKRAHRCSQEDGMGRHAQHS